MGALITEDYAKECLDELNEAVKINPSMFREDKVKSFYQDLYGTGDQKIYDVFGAYNKVYATEIRFTEDEFNAIKNVVKEYGFEIIEESKKESREEAMKRLGNDYNPVRDDYAIILQKGEDQFYLHVYKSCPNPGHFMKHAKANKLEVTYGFNRFCANKEDTRHFYTTPQTQFIMEQFDPKNFNAFIDILRAGLELRQYTQDNSDDYHDVLRDLYDMDDRRKHSTLKGRLQVIKKYEAKLAEKAKKEAEREAKLAAKQAEREAKKAAKKAAKKK